MPFRVRRRDASVEKAIHRISREQLDKAIATIDHFDKLEPALHDIRKRCKKLRGLVRLVRPTFADYRDENAAFRDIAKLFSELRDARVLQLTYDDLIGRFEKHIDRRRMGQLRRRLTTDRKEVLDQTDIKARLDACRSRLVEARDRAGKWKLEEECWRAISGGLTKTYEKAKKAADEAKDEGSASAHHALRKHVKYHWYHTRLLRNIWPEEMRLRARTAKEICDILGRHHDLAVFERQLGIRPAPEDQEVDIEIALVLARRQRVILEERVWPLIDHLLAQSPEELSGQWGKLWKSWCDLR